MTVPASRSERKRKLLIVQPTLGPLGGGEAVPVWMIEALRGEYAITVCSWYDVDVDAINAFYGTSLRPGDFELRHPPRALRRAVDLAVRLDPDPYSIQPWSALQRFARRIRDDYDAVLTAFNEADLGTPIIQYVHYPWCGPQYRRVRRAREGTWADRVRHAVGYQIRPWRLMAGFSVDRMRSNFTLVNSRWTRAAVRNELDIDSVVLYPPVPGGFTDVAWQERENGFVSIGRLEGSKRIEEMIEILARVRAHGHDVHLHMIGKSVSRAYRDELLRRTAEVPWLSLHVDAPRDELVRLASTHRYGLHAFVGEPFGIAAAELVRAGAIPFVRDDGGLPEIVGDEPRLRFTGRDDAVARIRAVLESPGWQAELAARLRARRELFTVDRFASELGRIVDEFISGSG